MCEGAAGKPGIWAYTAQKKGDAVGIIAARKLREPGTQLYVTYIPRVVLQVLHQWIYSLMAKFDGTVQFDGLRTMMPAPGERKSGSHHRNRTMR